MPWAIINPSGGQLEPCPSGYVVSGPSSCSQHSHVNSRASVTPVPGGLKLTPSVASTRHAQCEHIYVHIKIINLIMGSYYRCLNVNYYMCLYCVHYGEETGSFYLKSSFSTCAS